MWIESIYILYLKVCFPIMKNSFSRLHFILVLNLFFLLLCECSICNTIVYTHTFSYIALNEEKLFNPMVKLCNPMINYVTQCAMLYFFTHRVPQFTIGLQKFSSGYAILAPGYKFRGWQFETPGYTHTYRRGPACSVIHRRVGRSLFIGQRSLTWVLIEFPSLLFSDQVT